MMKGTKMKKSAVLSVLVLGLATALAAAPASADTTLYDNTGPTSNGGDTGNGAFALDYGYVVTDSFTLSSSSTVTSANFLIWLYPGDTLSNVDWSIGTSAFDTSLGAATATTSSLGQTNSGVFGSYNVYDESISIPSLSLGAGTYWFTLQNANTGGYPAFWDVSNGASSAVNNILGAVPSETFQILGTEGGTTVTPEPSSFLLLGSGLAGLAGLLKRKLRA
jgi:hypothetical protein